MTTKYSPHFMHPNEFHKNVYDNSRPRPAPLPDNGGWFDDPSWEGHEKTYIEPPHNIKCGCNGGRDSGGPYWVRRKT